MKRIYRIKDGFSLMEMMVVMLVVAVVMALSAPMITKKAGGAGGAGCLWTSLTGGNIGFNMNTNSISAIVGGNNDQITTLGVNVPKFTIASNSNFPHIGFVHEDLMSGTLMVANNNSISLGNNARTLGSNSIAIGTNANAATVNDTYKNSIAIGYFANAGGTNSIAIGANANAYDPGVGVETANAIAIGAVSNTANGNHSVAIGERSNAAQVKFSSVAVGCNANTYSSNNSVAVGRCATTYGSGSCAVAVGSLARANKEGSIAIGATVTDDFSTFTTATTAAGVNSIAIGRRANATSNNVICIGNNAHTIAGTSSIDAIAIGNNAFAQMNHGIAIGSHTWAQDGCIAIGNNANIIGNNSIAIGTSAGYTGAVNSVAIGTIASADDRSVAIGNQADASGITDAVVIGDQTTALANMATVVGSSSSAHGYAIAIGNDAHATGTRSVAIGSSSTASATGSIAIGNQASCTATSGVAIGTAANAGQSATALGWDSSAAHYHSTAIGAGATTTKQHQIVIGTSSDTVYIPGTVEFNDLQVSGNLRVVGNTLLGSYGHYTGVFATNNGNYGWLRRYSGGNDDKIWFGGGASARLYYAPGKSVTINSDKRLKDIIGENLDAMDKINRIKVYDFTFKKDDMKTPHVGVIAQELQKIFPNAVTKDENGYLQIRHEDMFYTMINALKELDARIKQIAEQLADNIKVVTSDSAKIKDLTLRVNQQDKEIKALKKEIAELKKAISRLSK